MKYLRAEKNCIYENKLFSTIDPKLPLVETNGFRYMDDQIAIAAFDNRNQQSKRQAISFVEALATCYDDAMIMENEASNITNSDEILETVKDIPLIVIEK